MSPPVLGVAPNPVPHFAPVATGATVRTHVEQMAFATDPTTGADAPHALCTHGITAACICEARAQ